MCSVQNSKGCSFLLAEILELMISTHMNSSHTCDQLFSNLILIPFISDPLLIHIYAGFHENKSRLALGVVSFYCAISLAPVQLRITAILTSQRTVHVPTGCSLHLSNFNFNASKSLPATTLFVSTDRDSPAI